MFPLPARERFRELSIGLGTVLKDLVPYNLRFEHVTRQNVIDRHTTTIAR